MCLTKWNKTERFSHFRAHFGPKPLQGQHLSRGTRRSAPFRPVGLSPPAPELSTSRMNLRISSRGLRANSDLTWVCEDGGIPCATCASPHLSTVPVVGPEGPLPLTSDRWPITTRAQRRPGPREDIPRAGPIVRVHGSTMLRLPSIAAGRAGAVGSRGTAAWKLRACGLCRRTRRRHLRTRGLCRRARGRKLRTGWLGRAAA